MCQSIFAQCSTHCNARVTRPMSLAPTALPSQSHSKPTRPIFSAPTSTHTTSSTLVSPICHATAAASGASVHTVEDIMTKGKILTCNPDTLLDDALEILVQNHVTGLPVVDATSNVVVGVVSDFDLLALEGVSPKEKAKGFFPEADSDWNSFYEVQKLVAKNAGKSVGDVMTADPITVRPATSIEDAANLLLRKKIRRLPVVDESGRLLGIITRSNVIKAAWEARKAGGHL